VDYGNPVIDSLTRGHLFDQDQKIQAPTPFSAINLLWSKLGDKASRLDD
jgi:hypothetical protein